MSEQQFSASLEGTSARSQFVVDMTAEADEKFPARAQHSLPVPPASLAASGSGKTTSSLPEADSHADGAFAPSVDDSNWREEVSAKVNRYKMRRPRQERYPSLRLQFEPVTERERKQSEERFADASSCSSLGAERNDSQLQALAPVAPVSVESTARVLEFPRAMAAPARLDELADPVIDRLRIVEAPELLPPPPAMGGILIEPPHPAEPERRPGFDMPLQSPQLSRRICAGLIDALLVVIATIGFGFTFVRITGGVPPVRLTIELVAGLLAVLWPAYQYGLLVFTGSTPGLRLVKLKIQRFDGGPTSRSLRRWRVLASVLSGVSLGLGYAWCFFDQDQLSWHDRITRTHLAAIH